MSWEALELISKLETVKTRSPGFGYHMTAVEINPRVAGVFKSQKSVTVLPFYSDEQEKAEVGKYADGFLPGADRKKIDPAQYSGQVRAELASAGIKLGLCEDRTGKTAYHPLMDSIYVVDIPSSLIQAVDVVVSDVKDYSPAPHDLVVCGLDQNDPPFHVQELSGRVAHIRAGLHAVELVRDDEVLHPEPVRFALWRAFCHGSSPRFPDIIRGY